MVGGGALMPPFYKRLLGHAYAIYMTPRAIMELAKDGEEFKTALHHTANAMQDLHRKLAEKADVYRAGSLENAARVCNQRLAKLEARMAQGEKERKATREADREFGRRFADVRSRLAAVETKLDTAAGTFTVDAKGFDVLSKRIDDIQLYGPK